MSDEKKYTERDVILRERAAFVAATGARYMSTHVALTIAAEKYPLPKVTRPRIVQDEYGCEWRFTMGYVAWRGLGQTEWTDKLSTGTLSLTINANRAAVIASLVASPTEEVDE